MKQNILFAGLPRRRRLAGIVTIGLWLGTSSRSSPTPFRPTQESVDWLYGVEARRNARRALAVERRPSSRPSHAGPPGPPLPPPPTAIVARSRW